MDLRGSRSPPADEDEEPAAEFAGTSVLEAGALDDAIGRIGDEMELRRRERAKQRLDRGRIEDTVRVEAQALPADGRAEEQCPSRGQHSVQLGRGQAVSRWIDRVSITAQTDVLQAVQGRQ